LVVAGKVDVLPTERGEVLEQIGIDGISIPIWGLDGPVYIDGIPERDCGCHEGKAARPKALLLEAPISDFSQATEKDGSCKRIAGFAFVEAGVNAAAKIDTLQPGEDKQGSFNPTQFAQGDR
jgi:hypothetical protein